MKSRTPGMRPLASRWIVGGAAVGWMTAAACGVWHQFGERQQTNFAAALADRALGSNGPSLRATLAELEQLGTAGIEPLVSLAASQRFDVATAAQQTITQLLASWEVTTTERGDVAAFAKQAATLARALDAHADQFGAESQRWANQLAQRLVEHSEQFPTMESWEILANCDRVLSRTLLPIAEPRVRVIAKPAISMEPVAVAPRPTAKPAVMEPKPQPAAMAVVGRALAELTFVEPPMPITTVRRLPEPNKNVLRPPLRAPEEDEATALPRPVGPVIDVPSPQDVRLQARAMRELPSRALVVKADESSATESAAAKKALRDRGFSDAVLELTRQLEAMPPRERRDALQRAAQLPSSDARKLLRWFVADEDAEVRLQALTILATTGDPKLGELARERAVEDADPRVAAFASELMRTR